MGDLLTNEARIEDYSRQIADIVQSIARSPNSETHVFDLQLILAEFANEIIRQAVESK